MNISDKIKKVLSQFLRSEAAKKVFRNSAWLISDKVFSMIIGVFVTAVVARYFGPDEYGQFNYALSFVTLFTAISTLGLETLTVKSLVLKEYDEGVILFTSLVLRIFGGGLLTCISSIIIRLVEPNDKNVHSLVLIMSFTMIIKSLEVIEYWIQAHQKAKISSIIRMTAYSIIAALKVALVFFKGNLIQYSLIYSIDALIIGIALIIAYFKYRENASKWMFSIEYTKYILSKSWYIILTGLMVTLYMQIDKIMLGKMLPSKTELGLYSAATAVAQMWYFIPLAVITSMQPVIMQKKMENEESYLNSIQLLYRIVAFLGITFGVLVLIFSNLIINILYGPQFLGASSILSISVWAGTFATLGSARGVWLISENLQKYSLYYISSGAVINIALNYFLIPHLGGYGAAIATLIAQIVVSIIAPLMFYKTRLSGLMILRAFIPVASRKDK